MWTRGGRWAIRAVIVPRPRASESAKEAAARSERRPLGRSEVSADGEEEIGYRAAESLDYPSQRYLSRELGVGLEPRPHRRHAGPRQTHASLTRAGPCRSSPPIPPSSPCRVRPRPTHPERLPNVIFPAPDLVFLWAPTLTADLPPSPRTHRRQGDRPALPQGCHRRVLPGRPQALPDHPDMHLRPRVQLNRVVRFRHHVHRRRQRSAPLPRLPHRGPRGARRHGRLRALTHPRSPPHA